MDWFRVDAGLPGHYKTKLLCKKLKLSRHETIGLLVDLWCWAAKNRDDGDLGNMTSEEISISIGWEGEPDDLVQTLVSVGFIDSSDGKLVIHDWQEKQPLLKQRKSMVNHRESRCITVNHGEDHRHNRQTDKQTDKTLSSAASPPQAASAAVKAILETWNLETKPPLPRVKLAPSPKRKRLIKQRLAEDGFTEAWPDVCRRVNNSSFCRGENGGTWIANLDDILRPGRWQEIAEGKYSDTNSKQSKPGQDDRGPAITRREWEPPAWMGGNS